MLLIQYVLGHIADGELSKFSGYQFVKFLLKMWLQLGDQMEEKLCMTMFPEDLKSIHSFMLSLKKSLFHSNKKFTYRLTL